MRGFRELAIIAPFAIWRMTSPGDAGEVGDDERGDLAAIYEWVPGTEATREVDRVSGEEAKQRIDPQRMGLETYFRI